jgi:hypothetical protein
LQPDFRFPGLPIFFLLDKSKENDIKNNDSIIEDEAIVGAPE